MAAWLVFFAAIEVTRPRPLVAALFVGDFREADSLLLFELLAALDLLLLPLVFFVLEPEVLLLLLALLLPAARVFAALLREAAVLEFEAMVFAARLLLAELLEADLLLLVGICFSLLMCFLDFASSKHS